MKRWLFRQQFRSMGTSAVISTFPGELEDVEDRWLNKASDEGKKLH